MSAPTTFVVLLRAINVGGHNKIRMAELRELLDQLGLTDVATYIQSGNIVCRSTQSTPGLIKLVQTGIAKRFGHDIEVIVRTKAQFEKIVVDNPYPSADPKASGVLFLADAFDGELDISAYAPAECHIAGANMFLNYQTKFSDSKLTPAWIEKQTGLAGTRRNWATVLKLQALLADG